MSMVNGIRRKKEAFATRMGCHDDNLNASRQYSGFVEAGGVSQFESLGQGSTVAKPVGNRDQGLKGASETFNDRRQLRARFRNMFRSVMFTPVPHPEFVFLETFASVI